MSKQQNGEGFVHWTTPEELADPENDLSRANNYAAKHLSLLETAEGAEGTASQALATANAYAGQIAQANTTAGQAVAIATDAKGTAEAIEGPISTRLGYLEAREGLAPGDVYDVETASVLAQEDSESNAVLKAQIEHVRIAPSLAPLTERAEPLRTVMIQGDGEVYALWARVGETPWLDKSTDGGDTWQRKARLPFMVGTVSKFASGTLLAIEEAGTTTAGGSNPRMVRSTDDGQTWVEVPAGLAFPPISSQGICEGTDGSIMVAEYGNIGTFQYRVRRSADDGLTWTTAWASSGNDPQGDPGHIHSVTYDHVAGKHLIFSDRPIVPGVSGPEIYASADNGQTWTLVGMSDGLDKPNFVTPMYFADYIAWGSDNQINGRVSRIRRDDFYAGRFDRAETVAQLSQKAHYFAFPLRPDVWALSVAGEHINSSQQSGGPGSTMNEVWLVSDNGALVSGGMESYAQNTPAGALSGVRPTFGHRRYDRVDHGGLLWVNMPTHQPRTYTAVPATQGWEPPSKRVDLTAKSVRLPYGVPLEVQQNQDGSGGRQRLIERNQPSYTTISGALTGGVQMRVYDNGDITFNDGSPQMLSLIPGRGGPTVSASGGIHFATNGLRICAGNGSPEGSVAAPVGSIYMNWAGHAGSTVWVKENGAGNTGWNPAGVNGGNTSGRPPSPAIGQNYFDTTIGKAIWWTGTAWRDAMGVAV